MEGRPLWIRSENRDPTDRPLRRPTQSPAGLGTSIWLAGALMLAVVPGRIADADTRFRTKVQVLLERGQPGNGGGQKLAANKPASTSDPQHRAAAGGLAGTPVVQTPLSTPIDRGGEQRVIRRPDAMGAGGARQSTAVSGSGRSWVLSTLMALGLVIGLVFGLRWLWSKMGGPVVARHSPLVEVLSRTTVTSRNHILLVRVGDRVLVLGDSASGLRTLADVQDPDQVASMLQVLTAAGDNSISRGFSRLLGRFDQEYDDPGHAVPEAADASEHRLDRARDSVGGLLARIRHLAQRGAAG